LGSDLFKKEFYRRQYHCRFDIYSGCQLKVLK
jgi:hypothetical protein